MNRTNAENSASGSRVGTSSSNSPIAFKGSAFNSLALDVSFGGSNSSETTTSNSQRNFTRSSNINKTCENTDEELWEDIGVIDYLEKRLGSPDESTEEERVEALKEVLQDSDIHEGDGDLSDFLFHVARTKHGRIYIRVIRTLLLNRGNILCIYYFNYF